MLKKQETRNKKQETRNKKQETMATTTATNHPFGICDTCDDGLDDDYTDDSQSVYDDDDIVNGDIVISFVCAGCQDGIIRGSREHHGRRTLSNKVYCIDCVSQAVKDLDAQ